MDFGEHLAHMAGEGFDITDPVPRPPPRRRALDDYFYDDEHIDVTHECTHTTQSPEKPDTQ